MSGEVELYFGISTWSETASSPRLKLITPIWTDLIGVSTII